MNQLDIKKIEELFDMQPFNAQSIVDGPETTRILPFAPDPLLLSAENIADILHNFTEA